MRTKAPENVGRCWWIKMCPLDKQNNLFSQNQLALPRSFDILTLSFGSRTGRVLHPRATLREEGGFVFRLLLNDVVDLHPRCHR